MQSTSDPPSHPQRRAHERHPLPVRVWASADTRGGWVQVLNVSLHNIGCLSERRFPLMSNLKVAFDVTGGRGEREMKPLEIEGIVARCDPSQGMWSVGLKLPHHNEFARERFTHYLRSRLAAALPVSDRDHS